ncbi:MAG: hypothetical protein LBS60_02180 [Deltaproteobacteria bacterium]|jgi:hypothetical protein|nr:hypothetical protein [Deltaproteobacteria bacterium]
MFLFSNAMARRLMALLLTLSFWGVGELTAPNVATANEAQCQTACQTGQNKLTAEKAKNQKRKDDLEILKEAERAVTRECFKTIYNQSLALLGYVRLPDLSQILQELCQTTQWSPPNLDYSLPQPTLKDFLK